MEFEVTVRAIGESENDKNTVSITLSGESADDSKSMLVAAAAKLMVLAQEKAPSLHPELRQKPIQGQWSPDDSWRLVEF